MKTKKLPKRAYSRKSYITTLVLYTTILAVCSAFILNDDYGILTVAFAVGCFIGVVRESALRAKGKKETASNI
jgi:hypothetical protein